MYIIYIYIYKYIRAVKCDMIMYDKENERNIAQQKQLFVISFFKKRLHWHGY